MGSLIGRALVALGVGYVTYKGVDVSSQFLTDQVKSNIGGLPSDIISFLAWCWVDKALGMVFSTWTSCLAVSGISGGITKFKIKGGS